MYFIHSEDSNIYRGYFLLANYNLRNLSNKVIAIFDILK